MKNTNLVEDDKDVLPVTFRQNPCSGCGEEVENVSANQRPWRPFWMMDRHEKDTLCRGR